MSGYATTVARISQLDALMRRADPNWGGSSLSQLFGSGASGAGTVANPIALSGGSPFSGVLESIYNGSAASGTGSAAPAYVGSTAPAGPIDFADYPDSLASFASTSDSGAVEFEPTSAVLARFDAVSSQIPYAAQIRNAAIANGIDPLLLVGLVNSESGFDSRAVSSCGAKGLTQLMPGTARSMGVADPFDPAQNLNGGARYLSAQIKRFGRVDLALAAYSAGPGAVARAGGLPAGRNVYVSKILHTFNRYKEAAS